MKIGVLALQGAFAEHISILRNLEVDTMPVRSPQQLVELDGLVIPGGESTTITKLLQSYDLTDKISNLANNGLPIFGTCAGMIVLAKEISDSAVQPIGAMDIKVRRNAFGRQKESFESELSIPVLGEKPFPGVFIRAPVIEQANSDVEVIAKLADGTMVAAKQDKLLACAFHPELTDDMRLHKYFLDIVTGER